MDLTVVIPCYNERRNVPVLVQRLHVALAGRDWEALFVDDDSPDGTTEAVRAIAAADPRIRGIRRVGRRGLASAVIEGALASSARTIAVMDADLQHDETRLPAMLDRLDEAGADIVVASRFAPGGDAAGLASPTRRRITALATRLAGAVLPETLSDPMSGYFVLRRELFDRLAPRLTGEGFKILLDLVLSSPAPLAIAEVGARFGARVEGESKLTLLVALQFGGLLLDKVTAGLVPLRFVAFALVGGAGLLVHLAVLEASRAGGLPFGEAQAVATMVAMVGNFWLNNRVTYRDRMRRGKALWRGLALFMLVCGVGAAANIGVARALYQEHSGWTPAGLLGAAIGLVWNYAVSSTWVWGKAARR